MCLWNVCCWIFASPPGHYSSISWTFAPSLFTMDRFQHVNCVSVISSENAGQSSLQLNSSCVGPYKLCCIVCLNEVNYVISTVQSYRLSSQAVIIYLLSTLSITSFIWAECGAVSLPLCQLSFSCVHWKCFRCEAFLSFQRCQELFRFHVLQLLVNIFAAHFWTILWLYLTGFNELRFFGPPSQSQSFNIEDVIKYIWYIVVTAEACVIEPFLFLILYWSPGSYRRDLSLLQKHTEVLHCCFYKINHQCPNIQTLNLACSAIPFICVFFC